jgi:hypothetical protein
MTRPVTALRAVFRHPGAHRAAGRRVCNAGAECITPATGLSGVNADVKNTVLNTCRAPQNQLVPAGCRFVVQALPMLAVEGTCPAAGSEERALVCCVMQQRAQPGSTAYEYHQAGDWLDNGVPRL